MTGPLILLVDDDLPLRQSVAEQLLLRDMRVVEAATAAEATAALSGSGPFTAILLAGTLPDGDGASLCTLWRGQGITCPIILLGGKTVAAANDHITKPFRLGTLLGRLEALLRPPTAVTRPPPLPLGPYQFHADDKLLVRPADGGKIRLTDKEAALLRLLHDAAGAVVARETLLEQVWGYRQGISTHTLETHIYRLRRKMEADAAAPALLLTEGGGYRLAP
ncbi:DNA-binding response regulator, OmpR family, contains REC and winged-helix (wHTH) domain [Azospirillum sp. RU38E]|nr:DNA-binding response regulator, OmpR family, contains REC and winged-helix (wHTH) domain [Azospirillum sp. RU38E]SNS77635.1 DNA-binding response regulator, OmpR family, contains REC and winged-helix (wHTH) domain [Azospirillum sp. RU37A]